MNVWKFSLAMTAAVLLLSGCNSRTQTMTLQNKNAEQALLIQNQQAQIEALKKELEAKKTIKKRAIPQAPKKNIKLKKVQDDNYSADYMYPGTPKKDKKAAPKPTTAPVTTANPSTNNGMNKTECIAMIGQDKFDKYTQMFGSESASIKRCNMLKAMR